MGKKDKERRNYSKEFKAEAAAPAAKREKPISQIAGDLGVNESGLAPGCADSRLSHFSA
jgi:transposase-like protein